jgi:hypothetical protein
VDVQVFSLGGAGPGYGTGNAALETAVSGGKKYLYLYETSMGPGAPDIAQNTIQTVPANIAAPFAPATLAAFQFAAHPGGTPGVVDSAGGGFSAAGGAVAIAAADGLTFGPTSVFLTPSSVAATFATPSLLDSQHSALWGYTSDFAPVIVNTSIQDGGNSAVAGTLGVPEPSSMLLLASGAASMVSYRLRRGKS